MPPHKISFVGSFTGYLRAKPKSSFCHTMGKVALELWMIRWRTLLGFFLILLIAFVAQPVWGQNHSVDEPQISPVGPSQVCSYITKRMTVALPTVPTLCSGEIQVQGYFNIQVVSPTQVLHGNLRRAWASALFQTIAGLSTDPSLKSACSTAVICNLSISDSLMAQHGLHYRIFVGNDLLSLIQTEVADKHAEPLSDAWYLSWWEALLAGKEAEHAQSADNAAQLGKSACEEYARKAGPRFRAFNKSVPTCSVMLATDKSLYIVLDTDMIEAMGDYTSEIRDSIGRTLDDTGYDGQVIVRSPFSSELGNARGYRIYPLRELEFAFEEVQSGVRQPVDADVMMSNYMTEGQTLENEVEVPNTKNVSFRLTKVVKVVPGASASASVFTTDGAEWSATRDSLDRCGVAVGAEIDVFVLPDKKPRLTTPKASRSCSVEAEFVRGW